MLSQERRELEEAAQAEALQGEEGEEEEGLEQDPIMEIGGAAAFVAPQTALPSMDDGPAVKKRAKARATKAKEEDEDEVEEEPIDADKHVLATPRLVTLIEMLGSCPNCFSGLAPSKILETREKFGHQFKGVGFEKRVKCLQIYWEIELHFEFTKFRFID